MLKRWKKKRAHKKAKCWEKPVHSATSASSVRICPHGVMYARSYDMFKNDGVIETEYVWVKIEDFFIETGCYDW